MVTMCGKLGRDSIVTANDHHCYPARDGLRGRREQHRRYHACTGSSFQVRKSVCKEEDSSEGDPPTEGPPRPHMQQSPTEA